jgi:hypothetical protein
MKMLLLALATCVSPLLAQKPEAHVLVRGSLPRI